MAQGRFSVTAHKRSSGQSVAAAIAYRAGVAIVDARTGELHDYGWRTSRQQIVTSALVGVGADHFGDDLQAFAAAVETAETRANSRIGRDIVANLPSGLPQDQQIALLTRMGTAISERYNTPCSVSLHKADPRGDDRNDHGHIWIGTRAIGLDGTFGPKIRVLDDLKTGPEEITALRTLYEYLTNQALERAGVEQRIDITKRVDGPLPQPRLGRVATAEERRAAIADGIDVKNMSAAELVCAHEPVTHAGRDLRDYVLSERAIERQLEQSRNDFGGLYRAELLEPAPPAIVPTPIQARAPRDVAAVTSVHVIDAPAIAPSPIQAGPQQLAAAPIRELDPAPAIVPTPIQAEQQRDAAAVRVLAVASATKSAPIPAGRAAAATATVAAIGESEPMTVAQPIARSWTLFENGLPSRQALADVLVTDEHTREFAWAELHDKVADTEPDPELPCSVIALAHHTDARMRTTGERSPAARRFETDDQDQRTVLNWIREQMQPVLDLIWGRRAAEKAQALKDAAKLEAAKREKLESTQRAMLKGGYREAEGPGARSGASGTYSPPDRRSEPPKR